jgi:hypothetical protein
LSNQSVMSFGRPLWPLLASVSIHALVAAAFIVGSNRAAQSAQARPESRDIWIGDTLEISDPLVFEPASESSDAREAAPADDAAPVPRRTAPKPAPAPPAAPPRTPGGVARSDEVTHARGFAKAFTRALPAANTGDPVWGELPLGPLGFVRVSVMLDDEGAVAESKVWDKPRKPPSYLARLVDRTLILLRGGRFALAKSEKGRETLKLDVTLSDRPMETGPLALGFDAPTPGNPGRAYFQLASGRLVVTKVTIEPD